MNLRAPEVKYEANGLSSMKETRPGTFQERPHSHNEIEILLIERGQGTWQMSGKMVTLKAGSLVVFWAVRPHQLMKASDNLVLHWLTMPLTVFVEWRLPENFAKLLLAGGVFVEPDKAMFPFDRHSLENWHRDLLDPDRERQRMALLEIEARLRRMALTFHDEKAANSKELPSAGTFNHHYFDKISQIADFVSKNFSQPMPVVDIAKHINMHPASATKLFKKICGMSLMQYITQHRIFHAQRLLMSTDMKIVDVALDSGYQSASRFYAAFKEYCGQSPQEYRQSVRRRTVSPAK
jgi:AraC family transcriptional regulator, melibiose operon regulatory protein